MQPLDDETLARVVDIYGLGGVTAHWPATHGIENRNHFLTCALDGETREYVLTIMEEPASSGAMLVELLDACESNGLPVAAATRSRDGARQAMINGKAALLCRRLPGRHVINPTAIQVAAIGRFLARMHHGTAAIAPALSAYPRGAQWLAARAEACRLHLPWATRRLMLDALTEVAALLDRRDVQALPTGSVHGDLFRDNALFDQWGLSGVLDFHHASRGFLIYDVAVAANDWCVGPEGQVDTARLLALLQGYNGVRPFERAELWHLPLFMLYAGLAFWLSRLMAAVEQRQGGVDRVKDPGTFERIVALRRWAPPRIDWFWLDQNVAARDR
jgi:homoserine kinase type II